jgi:hypothetical protein
MTRRKKTHDIGELLQTSDDPAQILDQIRSRFGLSEDHRPRPTKRRSDQRRSSVDTQTDDLDFLSERTVSKWLFGPVPDAREVPGHLEIAPSAIHEVPEDGGLPKRGVDDGSFPSDPLLLILRRRLREL